MSFKGIFTPKNPQKYAGKDVNRIVWRSNWERKYMEHLDNHKHVLAWASESCIIPYQCPFRKHKIRRYFPDFIIKYRAKDGKIKIMMIEIKPESQSVKPEKKFNINGKPSKTYIREWAIWRNNTAKWEAAKQFCEKRNIEFKVLTEYDLGIAKRTA